MENEQINWSKALLNSYSYLETICGAIDKTVLNYGIGSMNTTETMEIANRILSLISRKKFLINTKVLVDNVLRNISNDSARILTIKFVDKVKSDIASQVLNLSARTYFRKINSAVLEFATELKKQKFDHATLSEMYKAEGWILEIYNQYASKQKTKESEEGLNLLSMALKSIKQKSVSYGVC